VDVYENHVKLIIHMRWDFFFLSENEYMPVFIQLMFLCAAVTRNMCSSLLN